MRSWERWPPTLHARPLDLRAGLVSDTLGVEAMREFAEGALRKPLPDQARAAVHVS